MASNKDQVAEFLDIVYPKYTNEEHTAKETKFIKSLTPDKGFILDLGCGTGRHTIPLLKDGFRVVGFDESTEMMNILKNKLKEANLDAKLIHADIRKFKGFEDKFDTVICFWNALGVMAVNEKEAEHILKLIYDALKKGGRLIVEQNINPDDFKPDMNQYSATISKDGMDYETSFIVLEYDKKTNTTIAKEKILVKKDGKVIKKGETTHIQRWWKRDELRNLCKDFSKTEFLGDDFKPLKKPITRVFLVATK